nr:hypothetical protein Itr_chr09CG15060 [Ipomoea trifida]
MSPEKQGRPPVQAGLLPPEFTTAVYAAVAASLLGKEMMPLPRRTKGGRHGRSRRRRAWLHREEERELPQLETASPPPPYAATDSTKLLRRRKNHRHRLRPNANVVAPPSVTFVTTHCREAAAGSLHSAATTPHYVLPPRLRPPETGECRQGAHHRLLYQSSSDPVGRNGEGREDESLPSSLLRMSPEKQGRPPVQAGLLPPEFTTAVYAAVAASLLGKEMMPLPRRTKGGRHGRSRRRRAWLHREEERELPQLETASPPPPYAATDSTKLLRRRKNHRHRLRPNANVVAPPSVTFVTTHCREAAAGSLHSAATTPHYVLPPRLRSRSWSLFSGIVGKLSLCQ